MKEQGILAALHPLLISPVWFVGFSTMKPARNITQQTFCSRDTCSLRCVFLEQAAISSSHLGFKVVRYKCRELCFCPASLCARNAPEQNSQKRIRADLRNSLFPVCAWSPYFHALVASFSNASKGIPVLCSQAFSGKWSTQCHDLAVTFLSLLSCNRVGKKNLLRTFSPSCLTTRSHCSATQRVCSTFCCPEEMPVFS